VGTNWGYSAGLLRISAIDLVYRVAEYCAPICFRSAHCMKVDTQLNQVIWIMTKTVRFTQVEWLAVLTNVVCSDLRRREPAKRILDKLKHNPNLPLFKNITEHSRMRLKSRSLIWNTILTDESVRVTWKSRWKTSHVKFSLVSIYRKYNG